MIRYSGIMKLITVALLNSMQRTGTDERFRGKLNLDVQTGDLSIMRKGNTKAKEKSVVVGGSVTLPSDHFDAKIETDDIILWTFGAEKSRVATNAARPDKTDERFKGRVELNEETGSLTIHKMRAEDAGYYKLQIINSKETKGRRVNLILSAKEESVMVGGSVTLRPDQPVAEIETDDLILWTFGAKKSLVATNAAGPDKTDKRFEGRVKLDEKTGSLKINDITDKDIGYYKLQIIKSKETKGWRFNVILSGKESATAVQGEELTSV